MDKTVKIAVWHNLPSGGAKRLLMEDLKRLTQRAEVQLYTTSLSPEEFCPVIPLVQQAKVYEVVSNPYSMLRKVLTRWRQGSQLYAIQKALAKKLENEKIDLLYVYSCQIEHSPSILSLFKGPSVYYCQEGLREYYEPQMAARSLKELVGKLLAVPELKRRVLRDRKALRSAGLVFANSKYSRERIEEWYGVKAEVSYPGIDLGAFVASMRPDRWGDARQVLSVGRLGFAKGHDSVIEALGRLPKSYRYLTVIGDEASADERQKLEDLANAHQVTLRIAHRISDEKLKELYQTAWALVCAQRKEPFGLVPLEAMASGCPVVAVNEGGLLETVKPEKAGIRVTRDPDEIAAAILQIIENPTATHKLREEGMAYVAAEWDIEVVTKSRHDKMILFCKQS